MRHFMTCACALFLAAPAGAAEVGIPAGCEAVATLLRPNCEMYQVLHCEGEDQTQVDVYKDGVFLGEQSYDALSMVRWRRGALLQELTVTEGDFQDAPFMTEDAVLEIAAERARKQVGSDAAPDTATFGYRVEVISPAVRELDSGQTREVRRFRVVQSSGGQEGSDLAVDYDQALRMPIWQEGTVTLPDGTQREVSVGMAVIMLPGEAGFMQDSAPEGAACTSE